MQFSAALLEEKYQVDSLLVGNKILI